MTQTPRQPTLGDNIKAGCFMAVLVVVVIVAGVLVWDWIKPTPEERAASEARAQKEKVVFYAEVGKECRSRAVFKKSLGIWALTVPNNRHLVTLDEIFPDDENKIARTLEEIGAGDPVPYRDLLSELDLCQ